MVATRDVNSWMRYIMALSSTTSSDDLDPVLGRFVVCDYYCDSVGGNDLNDGRTPTSAFATIAAALTAIGSTANKSIGLVAGSTFRPSAVLAPSCSGLTIRAYGYGAKPEVLGSTLVATTWTVVTGTEYSTPLAYTPRTAFWINASTGAITKLRPGTAGALTANQYAVSGGNLAVNIGKDPTTERIEIAKNTTVVTTHMFNVVSKSNHTYIGFSIKFCPFSGISFDATPNVSVYNCVVSYNGEDGIDITGPTATVLIKGCTIQWNGYQTRNGGGGPGDGVSGHGGCSVILDSCTITDNDQTGVGHVQDTFCITRYCYLRNNRMNVKVYNSNTAAAGSHTLQYNIIVCPNGSDGFEINADPAAVALVTCTFHNNIFHSEDGSHFVLGTFGGGTSTVKNNIFSGTPSNGFANYNGLSGSIVCVVSVDYNHYQATAKYQSGWVPQTIGANETTGNPLYVDVSVPGSQNFNLQNGSPAKATGTSLGYIRDKVGNTVPFVAGAPCRGAIERLA